MTAPHIIAPAILSSAGGRTSRDPARPTAVLDGAAGMPARQYALSTVDRSGRVADRTLLRALGWEPGRRLAIRERAGVVVVRAVGGAVHSVDGGGFLRLPLAVRRRCRLTTGSQLLLAADEGAGVLSGYPTVSLDRLLAGEAP